MFPWCSFDTLKDQGKDCTFQRRSSCSRIVKTILLQEETFLLCSLCKYMSLHALCTFLWGSFHKLQLQLCCIFLWKGVLEIRMRNVKINAALTSITS